MAIQLITTLLAMSILLTSWVLFQRWVRKNRPGLRDDADVLQGRFGSCGACFSFEDCHVPEASVPDADVLKVDVVDELALSRLVRVERGEDLLHPSPETG